MDPSKTFQTFLGIGGALTDASAETFYKLPRDKQQEIWFLAVFSGIGVYARPHPGPLPRGEGEPCHVAG